MKFQEEHVQETKKHVLTILMEEQTRQIYTRNILQYLIIEN